MLRFFQRTCLALAIAGTVNSASAFSMLGPFEAWQIYALGFNIPQNGDLGGAMNLGNEYRWNMRTITYGFDSSFKTYFGQRGVDEINKAIAIINNVPPMSKMSQDLREFPVNTRSINYQATALGLYDLKSMALGALVEHLGLASPERYAWCLRIRQTTPAPTVYAVAMRNFDPVTLQPSAYVNDTLYTYGILDPVPIFAPALGDAVELPVDPLAFQFTAVASCIGDVYGGGFFNLFGQFYTGLTRDDVGGLRYVYSGKGPYVNYNIEGLVSDAITNVAVGGPVWTPAAQTNVVVANALRAGIDKITLREAKYDSMLGFFITTTNTFKDTYVLNSRVRKQNYQRILVQPNIIFGAADLEGGGTTFALPVILRSGTTNWVNNNLLNSQVGNAGPGIIQPVVFIVFSKTGPQVINQQPNFLEEQSNLGRSYRWASFDGTTNMFIYPNGTTIQDVERQVFGH